MSLKARYIHVRRHAGWFLVDVVIISLSYLIAFYLRATIGSFQKLFEVPTFNLFVIIITIVYLYAFGVYHRIWSRTSGDEVTILIGAVFASMITILFVQIAFLDRRPLPVSVIILGNALALVALVMARYRSRAIRGLKWRWRAVWKQEFPALRVNVLIVGAGESGQNVAKRLKHHESEHLRFRVIGFIDDDEHKQNMFVEGCRVIGNRTDIPFLGKQHNIGLIIMAIHNISGHQFRDIINYCEKTDARIKVAPDMIAVVNAQNGEPLLRDLTAEDYLGRKPIEKDENVDFSPIIDKTILVTGAAGSIGSELCRQLAADYAPQRLLLLDTNESGIYDLIKDLHLLLSTETELVPVLCDITRRDKLQKVFETYRPDVVFHAAAYKHVPMLETYPDEALRVNIQGTLNVSQLAKDFSVERFVLISTDKAVNPSSVMGASKRICELLVLALANGPGTTLFTAVRFGNVLASRGSVVPIFQRQIDMGGPVTVTDKSMTRYFMSIREAVNLILHASCLTSGKDLFMLKMGEEVRILDLAERMIRMRGLRPYVDIPIIFTGRRPGEKLQEELSNHFEHSLSTIHLDIVKLMELGEDFEPQHFIKTVCSLLDSGFSNERLPLAQLNDIIGLAQRQHEAIQGS
ncbi:MAG: polysaccharide biosynthesis protein [Chloroflexi bacterium]|nr:polysaccharide biosynthesis protein [Chloroflexota bacterium]